MLSPAPRSFIWSSRANFLEKETEGRITFQWNEAIAYGDTWSVPKDNPAGMTGPELTGTLPFPLA